MRSNDSSDFYLDSSYWVQGLSPIATDNGKNTNFSTNWEKYDYKNYSLANIHSLMSQDLNQLNHLINSGNSQVAIMFFSNGLGQQMLNQTSSILDQNADETQELSNMQDAISQLKQWFQQAAEQAVGSNADQQLTTEFTEGLSSGQYSIENVMSGSQNWLRNIYASSKEAIVNIDSLFTSATNPTSLANIWYKANIQTIGAPNFDCNQIFNGGSCIIDCEQLPYQMLQAFVSYLNNIEVNGSSPYAEGGNPQIVGPSGGQSIEMIFNNLNSYDYFDNSNNQSSLWTGFISNYYSSFIDSQSLQTVLSGFDTLSSSTASLGSQYQSKSQYLANCFNEMVSFISNLNNGISNASNVVNNNSTTN